MNRFLLTILSDHLVVQDREFEYYNKLSVGKTLNVLDNYDGCVIYLRKLVKDFSIKEFDLNFESEFDDPVILDSFIESVHREYAQMNRDMSDNLVEMDAREDFKAWMEEMGEVEIVDTDSIELVIPLRKEDELPF